MYGLFGGVFYSEQQFSIGNSSANATALLLMESATFPTALTFSDTSARAESVAVPTAIAWHTADCGTVSDVSAGGAVIRLSAESATYLEAIAIFQDSEDNDAGVTLTFGVNDWVLNAGLYELTLVHGLNFVNVTTDLYENGIPAFAEWVVVDTNTIQLQVPVYPDGRFTGKATLHKVI